MHLARAAPFALLARRTGGDWGGRTSRGSRRTPPAELADDVAVTRGVAVAVRARTGIPAKRLLQAGKVAVRRAEVVPPFADAVRLVDRDQFQVERVQEPPDCCVDSLRRDVDHLELARTQPRCAPRPLRRIERRVEERRADPDFAQRVNLVLHERDQRRHDQRHPAQQARRNLVRQRLAGARRHHADAVPPRHHRPDDLQLPRAERRIPENLLQRRQRTVVMGVGLSLVRALGSVAQ